MGVAPVEVCVTQEMWEPDQSQLSWPEDHVQRDESNLNQMVEVVICHFHHFYYFYHVY